MGEVNKQIENGSKQQAEHTIHLTEAPKKLKTWEEAIRELPSFIQKNKQKGQ